MADTSLQTVHATNLQLQLTTADGVERVRGGEQNDVLRGNAANNLFMGGLGEDTIDGRGGVNGIVEVRDADFTLTDSSLLIGTEHNALTNIHQAFLVGGDSDNVIDASAFTLGAVTLFGNNGNDTLRGGSGADELFGGEGNDALFGGDGNDTLAGAAGNDALYGGIGDDLLRGDQGDDLLNGGGYDPMLSLTDDDELRGGSGNDTYVFDQSLQLGTDQVIELAGGGYYDVLEGAGLSGIDVDLFDNTSQTISDHLILILVNPGQVEDAF
jgi:Ca2+-binding RTX toxin-like protein